MRVGRRRASAGRRWAPAGVVSAFRGFVPGPYSEDPQMSLRRSLALLCTSVVVLALAACSGGEQAQKVPQQQQEWAWVQPTQQQPAAQRPELAAPRPPIA